MSAVVIDTNVPVVANGRSPQAGPDCVLACLGALADARAAGPVVIDDRLFILTEYMSNLSMSGQPGPGDAFMKWVWQHQADPAACTAAAVTPLDGTGHNFAEFPADPALAAFDPPDRKFVAACLAHGREYGVFPPVLNAVDSDWWNCRDALTAHGVGVEFLCPDQFDEGE